MKAIARLAIGWSLLLAGAILMLDGGAPIRPRPNAMITVEVMGGFALAATGVWLRRTAARPEKPH